MSSLADNLHFIPNKKDRYFVEFFSGSKTISNVAESEYNYKTFTVDIEEKFSPALCTDISKMQLNQVPDRNKVFLLWASVPCTWFTILNIKDHWERITYNHRQYYYIPKTNAARKAIQLLEKTIWLIKKINPVYYVIENPRGALRHMPQINFSPFRYTVSYADFGADVYKPTDLFTNISFLQLPKIKTAIGQTFLSSVQDQKNDYERSIVPPGLVREILKQIDAAHYG